MSATGNAGEAPMPWKQIIGSAAHDMRTPLSCMRTSVEVMRMLATSEQDTRMMDILEKQIDTLVEQVDDLVNNPQAYMPGGSRSRH
jgi:nitrogen-specific signal transduction histidine kinase